MKKEILSVRNFNLKYSNAVNLKDISLSLMEGESTALLGLASSGKDAFLQVLTGNEWSDIGTLQIDNKKINTSEELREYVHRITEINYSISDWTIAEYIGLVSEGLFPLFNRKKSFTEEIQLLFLELGLEIDVTRKISELSELEKRVVDLVKAYRKKSRILVIEDEFDGAAADEIAVFKKIMDRLISGRMTAVIKTHSDSISSILADNFIIFKNGSVIKKCRKEYIKDDRHLEYFLLGQSGISDKKIEKHSSHSSIPESGTAYSVNNIITEDRDKLDFSFNCGEIVSILVMNIRKKEKIFNIISGREIDKNTEIFLEQKNLTFNSISDFVKNRVVSSVNLGSNSEFLDKMSVGENIIIPSLQKLSSLRYIFYGKKMTEILENQLIMNNSGFYKNFKGDETNLRILIQLERWYVLKPKVLVFLEPFLQCDVYGASIIKSYIRKFTDIGTAVIIVKAREKDIVDISNRIIKI